MTRIVKMCKEREYVKANDAYYEMAIGNAAWPIGLFLSLPLFVYNIILFCFFSFFFSILML